ncbi:hypothetical protein T439DRAFT_329418 [Meredithblackwellia eburnea MCA 4105]
MSGELRERAMRRLRKRDGNRGTREHLPSMEERMAPYKDMTLPQLRGEQARLGLSADYSSFVRDAMRRPRVKLEVLLDRSEKNGAWNQHALYLRQLAEWENILLNSKNSKEKYRIHNRAVHWFETIEASLPLETTELTKANRLMEKTLPIFCYRAEAAPLIRILEAQAASNSTKKEAQDLEKTIGDLKIIVSCMDGLEERQLLDTLNRCWALVDPNLLPVDVPTIEDSNNHAMTPTMSERRHRIYFGDLRRLLRAPWRGRQTPRR